MVLDYILNFLELLEGERVKWVVCYVGCMVARGFVKVARGTLEKEAVSAVPRGRVIAGGITAGDGGRRVREVEEGEGEEEEENRGEDEK